MREHRLDRINTVLLLLVSAVAVVFTPENEGVSAILIALSVPLVLMIPRLLKRAFKMKIDPTLELIFILYVFLAQVLGSMFDFYSTVMYYDKVMHLLSGVLSGAFALALLRNFRLGGLNRTFRVLFYICVTLAIASLWEFFEFYSDIIFARDAQRVLDTGVGDTMLDMQCAFIGSIIYSVCGSVWQSVSKRHAQKAAGQVKVSP